MRSWKMVALSQLLLFGLAFFVQAEKQMYIRDILAYPQGVQNTSVTIQGNVVEVRSAQRADERGFYVLMDNSDKTIQIVANTLPAPGTNLTVTGLVQIEIRTQTPYIRETSRKAAKVEPLDLWLMLLIGAIVLVVVLILVLVFRSKSQPVQAQDAQVSIPPPPPAPDKKTRQVSHQELELQLGGSKTAQVPHKLAQLVVSSGEQSGKSFPLKYNNTIGRESGDIILRDSSVSKVHARISFEGNDYLLENRSQTNPVVHNGQRIVEGRKILNEGDEIIFGLIKVQFRLI